MPTKTARPLELDDFDRAILQIVQRDNLMSHAAIGERVGLSASAVRRRLGAMREDKVIARDVALVDADRFGVTLVVTVTFAVETPEIYAAFEAQVQALTQVRQCYHVAGSADYILIVLAPSLQFYENWSMEQFMGNNAIRRYDSVVAWSCKKFETAIDSAEL
ncbi:MAG: Lrp/AsnC family transcriptional regulator [Hyphomonadaceae bacterium]